MQGSAGDHLQVELSAAGVLEDGGYHGNCPHPLTAQAADGADAVHLHPEASSSSHHRLPAPPPHLGLTPQEVEEEPWDRPLLSARQPPHSQSPGGRGRGGGGASGRRALGDVIGRGRGQDERGEARAEQRA